MEVQDQPEECRPDTRRRVAPPKASAPSMLPWWCRCLRCCRHYPQNHGRPVASTHRAPVVVPGRHRPSCSGTPRAGRHPTPLSLHPGRTPDSSRSLERPRIRMFGPRRGISLRARMPRSAADESVEPRRQRQPAPKAPRIGRARSMGYPSFTRIQCPRWDGRAGRL